MGSRSTGGVTPVTPMPVDLVPDAQVALNITAAQVVATGQRRLARVSVLVAGSAAGGAYDSASTSGNTVADQVFVIPNTVGVYQVDWPCMSGLVVIPGTGQTVAVAYY